MKPFIDMDEVWLYIEGFEGMYQVSNTGKVRSCERVETFISKRKSGDVLMTRKRSSGILVPSQQDYNTVRLYRDGNCYPALVHRLVAHEFVPNTENKPEVNHIDEDKLNNNASNLEWCTSSENSRHSCHKTTGSKSGMAKLTEDNVGQIFELLVEGKLTQTEIGKRYGVSNHAIHKIKCGANWGWLTGFVKEVK